MKIAATATSQIPSRTANSIQVMKAVQALAKLDNPVALWVPGDKSVPWDNLADHYGLQTPFQIKWVQSSPRWRRYDFALRSLHQIRAWKADLVYTWLLQTAVLALWANLPVILEMHDLPTGKAGPWLFRQFLKLPGKKRMLVITRALRDKLTLLYPSMAQVDTQIAPNGTELERYLGLPEPALARKQLGLSEMPTVAYSGHFYAGRGSDLLLSLAQHLPSVQFLWIGGRPEDVTAWKARFSESGINNVVLTGFIENMRLPLFQAAADVLLMPYERAIAGSSGGNSAEICSPMKMFDYLAAGRAIISSDLPVLHEVLNQQNAVFCPPDDLPSWKAALSALLENPQRRHALGSQSLQDAARYTWQQRANRALLPFEER